MAKLTREEFDRQNEPVSVTGEVSDEDRKALVTQVYNWQESEGIYAWDEESLKKELDISIDGFVLEGKNESGNFIAVQFFQPLDEDVDYEGVAFGFRLIVVQNALYTLQKEDENENEEEE